MLFRSQEQGRQVEALSERRSGMWFVCISTGSSVLTNIRVDTDGQKVMSHARLPQMLCYHTLVMTSNAVIIALLSTMLITLVHIPVRVRTDPCTQFRDDPGRSSSPSCPQSIAVSSARLYSRCSCPPANHWNSDTPAVKVARPGVHVLTAAPAICRSSSPLPGCR